MTELIIKSSQADAVKSEVRSALDNQRRALQDSTRRTRRNLTAFEERYGFSTAELLRRESRGTLDDSDLDLIEWLGEVRTLEYLEAELKLLEDIRVC
jgi:hypothetical protein